MDIHIYLNEDQNLFLSLDVFQNETNNIFNCFINRKRVSINKIIHIINNYKIDIKKWLDKQDQFTHNKFILFGRLLKMDMSCF